MNKNQTLISEEIKKINEKLVTGKKSIFLDMDFYYINFYISIFKRASKLASNTLIKTFYSDITLKFVLFKQIYLELLKQNSKQYNELKKLDFKEYEKMTEREQEILLALLLSGNFQAVIIPFLNLMSNEIEQVFKETYVLFNYVRIGLVHAVNEANVYFTIIHPSYTYEFQGKKYSYFSKNKKYIEVFNSIIDEGIFVKKEEKKEDGKS